jgi:voltage-gated potassium channel
MPEERQIPKHIPLASGGQDRSQALRGVRNAILLLGIIIIVGTAGYMVFEGWSLGDAFYMTIITITTAGYSEVRELDTSGRLWTIFLLLSGIGVLFYGVVALVELAVQGTIQHSLGRRRMKTAIGRLKNHYILCGYGRVGKQVAEELAEDGVEYVVVEKDPERAEECARRGHLELLGDASEDEVLKAAGIRQARGLISALDSDEANVFVTLSARKLNPDLFIVARASTDESAVKLEIAGADRTLSPYSVGGRRLASLATRPSVVDFLDVVASGSRGIEFRLEEFSVNSGSPLADRTIGELDVFKQTGARILAIISKDHQFTTNPTANDRISSGDTLIVLGTPNECENMERMIGG